jgi:HKD family nuclease
MIISNLESQLLPALTEAEEVWIAVALIDNRGYQKIQTALANNPQQPRQHYLIGIDLPTPPAVLRLIQAQKRACSFQARIAKYPEIFHAKVYIIRKNGRCMAIVGSANLTGPGLRGSHEISYLITDQNQCQELLQWFEHLYDNAYPLNDHNIAEYESGYTAGDERTNTRPATRPLNFIKPDKDELFFEDRDLSLSFFRKEEYLAFRKSLQTDRSIAAENERKKARERFLQLHAIIFPQFNTVGLSALDHHGREENIVSLPSHRDGFTNEELNAMWLSYGKKREEIRRYQQLHSASYGRIKEPESDRQTFINHARLQVRIEVHSLDISLLFAKNHASKYDREHFQDEMRRPEYRHRFFEALKRLPEPYWMRINNVERQVSFFESTEELRNFTREDNPEHYFSIGRRYDDITDPALGVNQLPTTVLWEFKRLYPFYELMRHRIDPA